MKHSTVSLIYILSIALLSIFMHIQLNKFINSFRDDFHFRVFLDKKYALDFDNLDFLIVYF